MEVFKQSQFMGYYFCALHFHVKNKLNYYNLAIEFYTNQKLFYILGRLICI